MTLSQSAMRNLGVLASMLTMACDESRLEPVDPRLEAGEVCGHVPAPRWVLRDKDGQPVKAKVGPSCGQWGNAKSQAQCLPLDFGPGASFPCVHIIDHEGRYIDLKFELATGLIEPCQGNSGDVPNIDVVWKEEFFLLYATENCEGFTYAPNGTRVIYGEGQLWYISEKDCISGLAGNTEHSMWDPYSQQCIPPYDDYNNSCIVLPIPDWVDSLLPNPPYSMAVEYE